MLSLLRYTLTISLIVGLALPAFAQFSVVPQFNTSIPLGSINEYTNPDVGYGLEIGYDLSDSWSVRAAYGQYHLELVAGLDDLNIRQELLDFLNLPEALLFDLQVDTWSGGIRYQIPAQRIAPYFGFTVSTNRINAEGLGLSFARRYWGVAPLVGAEWPITDHWGIQADVRVQGIFTRGDSLPLVGELIEDNIFFIPAQVGIVYRFGNLH
ncbi:outer membrane beta-barrel protein [Tunicatimonas pelagia]|uniref:outer membrane beta-barrel protein n=1 Tax=Tunicatimonas pelagia TaxID=931531 RepID=UPI00266531C3|nr:outer membrane beta-barrel protein [Tunicatimonas pelagia]WKN41749.1 outer membrane beta-barrel protein [Tunicatimonas pelagia]